MKVTNFLIEPAMCAPGDEVRLSFTLKAESGDSIGANGLYVWLQLPGIGEICCWQDAAFTISAGKSKNVSVMTVLVDTAHAEIIQRLGENRSTALQVFGVQMGTFGSRVNVNFPVTLLDAWYRPSISLLHLQRGTGGVPSDEGESLLADVLLGVSADAKTENMALRLYYRADAAADSLVDCIDLTDRIPDLIAGVAQSADLIPGIFSKARDWHFLLHFGDEFEWVESACLVARAFANLHLSGMDSGGVCFGGFCTSAQDAPLLESYYPAHFYGGIGRIGSGWTELVPLAGATPGEYGGGVLRCRAIENKRIIDGSVQIKPGDSNIILAQLPDGFAPTGNVYSLNPCSGGRVARISVWGEGAENAGKLALNWVKNMDNGENYTDAALWVQCSMEYWVD